MSSAARLGRSCSTWALILSQSDCLTSCWTCLSLIAGSAVQPPARDGQGLPAESPAVQGNFSQGLLP